MAVNFIEFTALNGDPLFMEFVVVMSKEFAVIPPEERFIVPAVVFETFTVPVVETIKLGVLVTIVGLPMFPLREVNCSVDVPDNVPLL